MNPWGYSNGRRPEKRDSLLALVMSWVVWSIEEFVCRAFVSNGDSMPDARGRDLVDEAAVVGVCFCSGREVTAPLRRCHRFLWADRLVEHGATYIGEVATPRAQGDLFAGFGGPAGERS